MIQPLVGPANLKTHPFHQWDESQVQPTETLVKFWHPYYHPSSDARVKLAWDNKTLTVPLKYGSGIPHTFKASIFHKNGHEGELFITDENLDDNVYDHLRRVKLKIDMEGHVKKGFKLTILREGHGGQIYRLQTISYG